MGLNQALQERLEAMEITDPLTKRIHIKMSGCPNGCRQHHIANIGFYGASIKVGERTIPAYIPHIGGNFEGGEVVFGHRLKARLPAKRVPEAVERWIRNYEAERDDGEDFNALRRPHRHRPVRGAEVTDLTMPVEFSLDNLLHFIDWNRSEPYKVERGEGECAVYEPAATRSAAAEVNGNGRKRSSTRPPHRARRRARRELNGLGFDPEEMAAELEEPSAEEAIGWALETFSPRLYIACSFQKTSSVTVDMAHRIDPNARFFYLDTDVLFPETYDDQGRLARALRDRLPPLQHDHPRTSRRASTATSSGPATRTPAAGSARSSRCARRSPASTAGSRASAASTRRPAPARRSSAGTSASGSGSSTRWPTGPRSEVWGYINEHDIPYNPLHDQGYPSIGCTHCTRKPGGRRGRARRPLGRDSTRPSAACTGRRGLASAPRSNPFIA